MKLGAGARSPGVWAGAVARLARNSALSAAATVDGAVMATAGAATCGTWAVAGPQGIRARRASRTKRVAAVFIRVNLLGPRAGRSAGGLSGRCSGGGVWGRWRRLA